MIKRIRFSPSGEPVGGAPPVRATVCTVLPELTPDTEHERIAVEWFTDLSALDRSAASAGAVVVADECVMRGAGWLEERWRDRRDRFVHLSMAVRADGLTAADFSERWRSHAGQASGTTIPDAARGCAYVQDHPCRPSAYDAVSEAWFDDLDGLRARVEWFRANRVGQEPDDLFERSWSLAVREEVLWC